MTSATAENSALETDRASFANFISKVRGEGKWCNPCIPLWKVPPTEVYLLKEQLPHALLIDSNCTLHGFRKCEGTCHDGGIEVVSQRRTVDSIVVVVAPAAPPLAPVARKSRTAQVRQFAIAESKRPESLPQINWLRVTPSLSLSLIPHFFPPHPSTERDGLLLADEFILKYDGSFIIFLPATFQEA